MREGPRRDISDGSPLQPPGLIAAVRQVLRPVVRVLLHFQITYPAVAELLKGIYISVAQQELPIEGRRQTDSRLSLLTGIHRKDVKRLRGAREEELAVPASVSLGGQLVARWSTEAQWRDEAGRPLVLRRSGDEAGPSFEGLVRSVTRDVRPRAILDELERLGVVEPSEAGVRLVQDAFVPDDGLVEKAFFFGRNLHDHLAAAGHNLMGRQPSFPERSAYHGSLSQESADALRDLASSLATDALKRLYEHAAELHARDARAGRGGTRVRFGTFFYSEPEGGIEETDGDAT